MSEKRELKQVGEEKFIIPIGPQHPALKEPGHFEFTVDGELVVDVPLVGAMAERRIVPGLLRRLDIEAAAVDEHLARP